MIQAQPAQRGPIGAQHGLQQLTETLAALSAGQQAQAQRDTHLQAQLATLAQQCTAQAEALAHLRTWGQRLVAAIAGLSVLVLALGAAVGWQAIRPDPALPYVRAVGALDAVLMQQWGSLPKPVQAELSSAYSRAGLTPPSQRK